MLTKWLSCAAVVGAVAIGGMVFAQEGDKPKDPQKPLELTPAAADALKAAFPKATVGRPMATKKQEAIKGFEVSMREGTKEIGLKTFRVIISDTGVIAKVVTPTPAAEAPKAVTEAVATAVPGGQVRQIQKVETRANDKLEKVDPPTIAYDITLAKPDALVKLTVSADGKVTVPPVTTPMPAPKEKPKASATDAPKDAPKATK